MAHHDLDCDDDVEFVPDVLWEPPPIISQPVPEVRTSVAARFVFSNAKRVKLNFASAVDPYMEAHLEQAPQHQARPCSQLLLLSAHHLIQMSHHTQDQDDTAASVASVPEAAASVLPDVAPGGSKSLLASAGSTSTSAQPVAIVASTGPGAVPSDGAAGCDPAASASEQQLVSAPPSPVPSPTTPATESGDVDQKVKVCE